MNEHQISDKQPHVPTRDIVDIRIDGCGLLECNTGYWNNWDQSEIVPRVGIKTEVCSVQKLECQSIVLADE